MCRFAIADGGGVVVQCGPVSSFDTEREALLMLIFLPNPAALDYHVVPVDGEFPTLPLPPLPRLES